MPMMQTRGDNGSKITQTTKKKRCCIVVATMKGIYIKKRTMNEVMIYMMKCIKEERKEHK